MRKREDTKAASAAAATAAAKEEAKTADGRMWEECVDEGEAFVTAMLASVVRSLAEGPKTEFELDQVRFCFCCCCGCCLPAVCGRKVRCYILVGVSSGILSLPVDNYFFACLCRYSLPLPLPLPPPLPLPLPFPLPLLLIIPLPLPQPLPLPCLLYTSPSPRD